MFALAVGVQQIDEVLPAPAYALLSGLNASTVGIVALAAVQVSDQGTGGDLRSWNQLTDVTTVGRESNQR